MLWGNPALLVAKLASEAWMKGGSAMKLGSVNVVGDLPVYVYRDADGDQVALPCTERLYTERQANLVAAAGVIPVVSLRGRPEVRVAGFGSVAGAPLAGRWAPVEIKPPPTPPPPPPPPAAPPPPVPPPAAPPPAKPAPAPAGEDETADLDALLADLGTAGPDPAPTPPPEPPEDDSGLDALLASLGAEPPPAAADETDADLDALLASLK